MWLQLEMQGDGTSQNESDPCFFLLPFLDILSMCFILFLFLRDADSRKGTLCPFYVPNHKKKEKKSFRYHKSPRMKATVPSIVDT